MGGQRHAPATLPLRKPRYPLYRRLGGHQGLSGRVRKIPPPPEFDSRTIQLVASRYTDWTILAHWQQQAQHQNLLAHQVFLWCAPTANHYKKKLLSSGKWSRVLWVIRIATSEELTALITRVQKHGCSRFFRKVSTLLLHHTSPYPRGQQYSQSPSW